MFTKGVSPDTVMIMLKTLQPKLRLLDRRARIKFANHVFFVSAAALFVVQQVAVEADQRAAELPMIAQALHYQPMIPPPGFDPDQLSVDEVDPAVNGAAP